MYMWTRPRSCPSIFCFYVSVNSFWQCLCNTMNCRQEIRPIHLCWYKLKIFYKVPTFPGWGMDFTAGKKKKILWGERGAAKENIGHFNDLQKHIGHRQTRRVHLYLSYLFGFSYCSWSFQSKNIERVFHFPYPMDHILPEFSTMSNPSYMALHGMSHRCI